MATFLGAMDERIHAAEIGQIHQANIDGHTCSRCKETEPKENEEYKNMYL